MMVKTCNLNQAAMLVALGGEVLKIRNGYPQWEFYIQVKPWQIWYEKHIGLIPYRYYVRRRVWLKQQFYKTHGRGDFAFRGKADGFLFGDIARVIPFSRREREHLKL